MAAVVWCFTHGHAIQHFFETHPRDAIRELTRAAHMYKTREDRGGGSRLGCGDFSNCSPQMGTESMHTVLAPANYIQAFSSLPMST